MIKRIILCAAFSTLSLCASQQAQSARLKLDEAPKASRISMPSPIKVLLSALLLTSAQAIDPTRAFFCTYVGGYPSNHYGTICSHYNEPLQQTNYASLQHDTQRLCHGTLSCMSEPDKDEARILRAYNKTELYIACRFDPSWQKK